MRLCSYVIKSDTGFAPNPFWGYCTLAACIPNHMGAHLGQGDWIIGTESVRKGNRLTYVMRAAETLSFEHYYTNPRFEAKRPVINGTWRQCCGDNIYFKDDAGEWKQDPKAMHHLDQETIRKGLRHPYVFVAKHFYYFGEKAMEIPSEYQSLIWRRQGCKCEHDPDVVKSFLDWLQTNIKPGIYGNPGDNDDPECERCKSRGRKQGHRCAKVRSMPHNSRSLVRQTGLAFLAG